MLPVKVEYRPFFLELSQFNIKLVVTVLFECYMKCGLKYKRFHNKVGSQGAVQLYLTIKFYQYISNYGFVKRFC